jgi:hypothetical protein
MSWIRIDDHFDEHPKLARVGPLGWALWIAGLAYCNRNLTDGFIPFNKAHAMMGLDTYGSEGRVWTACVTSGMSGDDVTCKGIAGWLVEAGLWEIGPGGYQVHDYLAYQPSKKQVLAERAATARRQERFRERHYQTVVPTDVANSEDGGVANPGDREVDNASETAISNTTTNAAPGPNPVPGPGPGPEPEVLPRVSMSSGVWVPDVATQVQSRASPLQARPDPRRTEARAEDFWDATVERFADRLGGSRHVRTAIARAEAHGRYEPAEIDTWLEEDAARYQAAHASRASPGAAHPAARDGREGDLGRDAHDEWLAGVDARMRERTRSLALLFSVPR